MKGNVKVEELKKASLRNMALSPLNPSKLYVHLSLEAAEIQFMILTPSRSYMYSSMDSEGCVIYTLVFMFTA